MISLPRSIEEYRIKASSPSRDLLTLGRFYAEVGGYYSTIIQSSYQESARKCKRRLARVIDELIDRDVIHIENDLYAVPDCPFDLSNLESKSVDELECQYRLCSSSKTRQGYDGRETFTYFRQAKILKELKRRTAANRSEQILIDYCNRVYRNNIENLAFTLRMPQGNAKDVDEFDASRDYSPAELIAMLRAFSKYQTAMEREAFVECVYYSLDLIERCNDKHRLVNLISELADLGLQRTVKMPNWLTTLLHDSIIKCSKDKAFPKHKLVYPMLILANATKDYSWWRKASRIINPCYRKIISPDVDMTDIEGLTETINIAVTCSEFVTRYSFRKTVSILTSLYAKILESPRQLTATQLFNLIEAGKEYVDMSPRLEELTNTLMTHIETLASEGNIEANAYVKVLNENDTNKIAV